ncbi:hypothetical protein B0H11DRAFT_180536 [Mycena galericulata]|nr:hypothetical protein B0H11DRAFT_180536 [Mycena galericulata]
MDSTTLLTKPSTKSSRSLSTGPVIVNLDGDNDADQWASSSPTRPRITTRPLRRKKHLSIYRVSAPAQSPVAEVVIEIPSVQRPQSMISPSSVVYDRSSLHPPARPQMHNRTYSQPSNVRLGHPSRPYYSAIRPNSPLGNSSRPTSMLSPHASSIQPSPMSSGYSPKLVDDTDDDETLFSPAMSRPSSRFSFGFGGFGSPASSALHSGSSVSGEMEMRMALAALAREARQQDPSLQFEETGKHSSVSWRARKLAKGLKDLIRGKHAYTGH